MSLFARLSFDWLETRDNPSGPDLIDPYTIPAPPAGTTPATTTPAPVNPATAAGAAAGAAAAGAATTGTTDTNGIYKTPIDATLLTPPQG